MNTKRARTEKKRISERFKLRENHVLEVTVSSKPGCLWRDEVFLSVAMLDAGGNWLMQIMRGHYQDYGSSLVIDAATQELPDSFDFAVGEVFFPLSGDVADELAAFLRASEVVFFDYREVTPKERKELNQKRRNDWQGLL